MAKEFYKDTDGKAIDVTLSHDITGEKPILVNNIPGFPYEAASNGDTVALSADGAVYRVYIGASLTVALTDTLYVDTTAVSGTHEIPVGAYTKVHGADTVPFLRITAVKDSNNYVEGKLINFNPPAVAPS